MCTRRSDVARLRGVSKLISSIKTFNIVRLAVALTFFFGAKTIKEHKYVCMHGAEYVEGLSRRQLCDMI